jgi:hypothetical protein
MIMAYKDKERKMEYQREYQKRWYREHRERLLEKRKQHDEELRQWLRQYKNRLGCVECGENHPACLHFHHRHKEEKSFTISHIVGRWRYTTLEKLQEEISKCTILCGNCHAIFHWRETHDSDEWREVLS